MNANVYEGEGQRGIMTDVTVRSEDGCEIVAGRWNGLFPYVGPQDQQTAWVIRLEDGREIAGALITSMKGHRYMPLLTLKGFYRSGGSPTP